MKRSNANLIAILSLLIMMQSLASAHASSDQKGERASVSSAKALKRAHAAAQRITHPVVKVRAHASLGVAQFEAGDESASRKTLDDVLKWATLLLKDPAMHPFHRTNLGCNVARLITKHDLRQARQFLDQLLADVKTIDNARNLADALQIIADCETELNFLTSARLTLAAARAAAERVEDHGERNRLLNVIATIYLQAGRSREALRIARATVADGYYGWSLPTIALALSQEGDDELARDVLDDLLVATNKLGKLFQAQELARIARAQLDMGDPERASQTLAHAVAVARQSTDAWQVELLCTASAIESELDFGSTRYFDEALGIASKTTNAAGKAKQLTTIGRSLVIAGSRQKGLAILADALEHVKATQSSSQLWIKKLALTYVEVGEYQIALHLLAENRLADRDQTEVWLAIADQTLKSVRN